MSRKRSRTITGKIPIYHYISKPNLDGEKYFGHKISPFFPNQNYEDLNQRKDKNLGKISCGGSSSSSLSGYDEFENEATRKVEKELLQMNKVLLRQIPLPKNYDRDEYELWMSTFPDLSLWDANSIDNNKRTERKEFIQPVLNKINNAVAELRKEIDSEAPCNKYDKKQHNYKRLSERCSNDVKMDYWKANGTLPSKRNNNTNDDIFSKKIFHPNDLEKVRALSRSEFLSSRWLKGRDNNDYNLPKIFSASAVSTRDPVKKSNYVEKKAVSGHSFVLPPIQNGRNSFGFHKNVDNLKDNNTTQRKRYSNILDVSSNSKNSSAIFGVKEAKKKSGDWN